MGGLKSFIAPVASVLGTAYGGPVGSVLGGLVGGAAAKALSKPKTPDLPAPTVMPGADDEAVKAARRRQIAEIQARSGRASTILSQSDTLGG